MKELLITGAAGRIGTVMREGLRGKAGPLLFQFSPQDVRGLGGGECSCSPDERGDYSCL